MGACRTPSRGSKAPCSASRPRGSRSASASSPPGPPSRLAGSPRGDGVTLAVGAARGLATLGAAWAIGRLWSPAHPLRAVGVVAFAAAGRWGTALSPVVVPGEAAPLAAELLTAVVGGALALPREPRGREPATPPDADRG